MPEFPKSHQIMNYRALLFLRSLEDSMRLNPGEHFLTVRVVLDWNILFLSQGQRRYRLTSENRMGIMEKCSHEKMSPA